jgi:predicted DNA-binding antitoxin AbrB/MazE fold protein
LSAKHTGHLGTNRALLLSLCYNLLAHSPLFAEKQPMTLTVEAVYENGVLKPAEPLPLKEHERVRVTLESAQPPIWDRIAALTADAPPEEIAKLPPGGAGEIDQFLYGGPKRAE